MQKQNSDSAHCCCCYVGERTWVKSCEFKLLTASGRKLLNSLVGRQQEIFLFLLPYGSSVSRLWLGWVMSFSIFWVLSTHLPSLMSLMLCRVPVMLWEVLIAHCRAFLYWAVQEPARMFSIAPLWKLTTLTLLMMNKLSSTGANSATLVSHMTLLLHHIGLLRIVQSYAAVWLQLICLGIFQGHLEFCGFKY